MWWAVEVLDVVAVEVDTVVDATRVADTDQTMTNATGRGYLTRQTSMDAHTLWTKNTALLNTRSSHQPRRNASGN